MLNVLLHYYTDFNEQIKTDEMNQRELFATIGYNNQKGKR